jgi:hypothetical protein
MGRVMRDEFAILCITLGRGINQFRNGLMDFWRQHVIHRFGKTHKFSRLVHNMSDMIQLRGGLDDVLCAEYPLCVEYISNGEHVYPIVQVFYGMNRVSSGMNRVSSGMNRVSSGIHMKRLRPLPNTLTEEGYVVWHNLYSQWVSVRPKCQDMLIHDKRSTIILQKLNARMGVMNQELRSIETTRNTTS